MYSGQDQHGGSEQAERFVLLKRLVNFRGPITRQRVLYIINRILYLVAEDPQAPLLLEIDSPGGMTGLAPEIIRIMDRVNCPVATFCRGEVRGTVLVVAAHGSRNFRVAVPGCRFSLWSLTQEGAERTPEAMMEILLKDCGVNRPRLRNYMENGAEFGSQEALQIGLIDAISPKPLFPGSVAGSG